MFLTKLNIVAVTLLDASMLDGAGVWYYQAAAHQETASNDSLQQENQRLKREVADANEKIRKLEDQLAATKGRSRPPLYQGKPPDYWIERLRDLDPQTRLQALQALGPIAAVDRSVVPVLEESLRDPDICGNVAEALARIGPDAVPKLAELLKDENPRLRLAAVAGLGRIGPRATLALVDALKDTEADVRASAVCALSRSTEKAMNEAEAKVAIPALIQALALAEANLCASAAIGLGNLGPAAAGAVPALTEHVKDKDNQMRQCTIIALGRIGPAAKTAVPAILAAMDQKLGNSLDRDVRIAAEEALAKIDPRR